MTGSERSSSLIPIVVAVIGLITALVTSPLWGEPLCRAAGVCQGGGSHSASADNPKTGHRSTDHNSSKQSSKPTNGTAEWSCPGGLFCAWDDAQGAGTMIVQKDATCSMHDIGSAGLGDRLTSYQNRTGKSVALYNWTGAEWQLLVNVPDGAKGDMPQSADNVTDAVKICA
ncbi:peptidase inhibitor family I36 protein [Nonomuraea sediminis]|uniref:peptidase inhibitor family I36 protein n=1 Tax=Nonomuraea sediminis TaxID=2835864 RepID=UPI001BDBED35|nr:peptidase inhibitor family I36 protein [Nonomuraea sediminis]